LDSLIRSRVDIVIAIGLTLPDADATRFAEAVPMVAVTRRIPGVDSVYPDDETGARAVVEHLTGLGHRDIAFLANPESDGYRGRGIGYRAAMDAAGLPPRTVPSSYVRSQAAADAATLLDEHPPTAIFAHNDQAALGVLDAAAARGLRVPGELSVVGYDNSTISRPPGTALTTVDVRAVDLGTRAAQTALNRLADPNRPVQEMMLTPALVARGTSGPVATPE
jgi:DNA-binding LacI/PurR family transcriptional regulator